MKVRHLRYIRNLSFVPTPNEAHVIIADTLPSVDLVTSAFALAFTDDRLLMAELRQRGWDLPGGHVEAAETPEEAMRREIFEETGAHLQSVYPFAHIRIRLLGPCPDGYRYPYPDSYLVFFLARILELRELTPTPEVRRRGLFPPEEARRLVWVKQNPDLYEAALARITGKTAEGQRVPEG